MKALWSQSLLADYLAKLTKLTCLSNSQQLSGGTDLMKNGTI